MAKKIKYLQEGQGGDQFFPYAHASGVFVGSNKMLDEELENKAPKADPSFLGVPTAPTAPTQTSTTQLATTQFVQQEIDRRANGFTFTVGQGNFVATTVEALTSIL